MQKRLQGTRLAASPVWESGLQPAAPRHQVILGIDPSLRGTGYGIYTLAFGLGATIGPVLGGWVYDTWGHDVPFYLNAGILVLGALLVLVLVREGRRTGDVLSTNGQRINE